METELLSDDCKLTARAVKDALEVLNGKWKFAILAALQDRKFRFRELAKFLEISPRMLSKELQELEMNQLISRTVLDTKPITVEYEMTDHGRTLEDVIFSLRAWGIRHRSAIMNNKQAASPNRFSACS